MIPIFFCLFTVACAAPQYFYHHGPPPPPRPHFDNQHRYGLRNSYFNDDMFDTRRFWSELSTELKKFDEMLQDFYKHFPSTVSSEGVDGDVYKITITLSGFDEKDIAVKAREGMLMIQAIHKTAEGLEKNYIDLRTLPSNVNVSGSWTYDKDVLKIVFPIIGDVGEITTIAPVTEGFASREEIQPEGERGGMNTNADVEDIDFGRDNNKDIELVSNQIPSKNTVEATTYAVDLKNEVEFVPIRY